MRLWRIMRDAGRNSTGPRRCDSKKSPLSVHPDVQGERSPDILKSDIARPRERSSSDYGICPHDYPLFGTGGGEAEDILSRGIDGGACRDGCARLARRVSGEAG